MKINKNNIFRGGLMIVLAGTMVGCSDGFLEQDPLSFYEPATTYSTEAGLQAALAQCEKQLKTYRIDGNWNNVGIFTNQLSQLSSDAIGGSDQALSCAVAIVHLNASCLQSLAYIALSGTDASCNANLHSSSMR